jgi:ATP-dependent DNA helicase RecQ
MPFLFPRLSKRSDAHSTAPDNSLGPARRVLRTVWGFEEFRPAQIPALRQILGSRDGLVLMPTGGGKSLSFQVPALVQGGLTIVISPLISLMQDQVGRLAGLGIPAFAMTGRVGYDVAGFVNRRIRSESAFFLYMAPERIGSRLFRRMIHGVKPQMIVVDEAHCISSWGHDFRPDYRRIAALRDEFGSDRHISCVAFTATATPRVARDILGSLRLRRPFRVTSTLRRPNLCFVVVKSVDPTSEVLRLLRANVPRMRGFGAPCAPSWPQMHSAWGLTSPTCVW